MKRLYYIGILFALFGVWGCETVNPLEEEQYKKQIYLVGAYDHVFTQTVYYNDTEEQETFISYRALFCPAVVFGDAGGSI